MSDLIQGSPEWLQARCGSVGASEVAKVIRKTKTGISADRANLLSQKVLERLTGAPANGYVTDDMRIGTEREPRARGLYEMLHGPVTEIGLVPHPRIPWSHASPDGLIGDDGLLEIKCPQPPAHLDILRQGKIPAKYETQMQWQMACTGRLWAVFMTFNPDFPARMQHLTLTLVRDEPRIGELEDAVAVFNAEVADLVAALEKRYE